MDHNEGWFESAYGEPVYYQNWTPEGDARAVLLLVHGLAEHSGRYRHFAEYFTTAGYALCALDHPGHGRSAGKRCHIRRFSDFMSVLDECVNRLKDAYPGVPRVIVGHSMGGLIAAAFLLERQSEFVAAVVSGAAIRTPQPPSRFVLLIVKMIASLLPGVGVMQLDSSGVSRDPQVVDKYDNDPLVHRGKVSARLAAELFAAMDSVLADAPRIQLPMLLLHGGSDSLTDVNGSKLLHDRISSEQKKIIVYDGLFHEVYNEPEQLAVMADVKAWLDGCSGIRNLS